MNAIRDWFNSSRSYQLGVALFDCHSDNAELKQVFAQGSSTFRHKLLVTELRKLLDAAERIEVTLPPASSSEPEPPKEIIVQRDKMPETIVPPEKDPYREQWMPLFKEMNMLRYRLRVVTSDPERGEMAFRILELEAQCQKWWDMRDYFLRTGTHQPEETEDKADTVTDRNALQKRLQTVRTYVTRYKDHPIKLNQYIRERDALEEKLGYERTTQHTADTSGTGTVS